jgi:hypothetical protein
MKLGLLVFGQFRSYKTWFPYNLQQIRTQFPDAEIDIFILSNRLSTGNYSKEAEEEIKLMCAHFNITIKLFTFWEDHPHLHEADKNIYEYNTKVFMKGIQPSYNNDWMMNMWFRRYCLWKMATPLDSYTYVLFLRAFDTRLLFVRPIQPTLETDSDKDTIFFCNDHIFLGSPHIMEKFFRLGRNIQYWKDFEWTPEFTSIFTSIDMVLGNAKQTFCSESQVLYYILNTFSSWKNIRVDHNCPTKPSNAIIDSRLDRQV